MRDKDLGRDGIIERYDFRGKIINGYKIIGTLGGGVFMILSLGPNNVGEILVYGGAGIFSYLSATGISKLNDKLKEKALKNLESRAAA